VAGTYAEHMSPLHNMAVSAECRSQGTDTAQQVLLLLSLLGA